MQAKLKCKVQVGNKQLSKKLYFWALPNWIKLYFGQLFLGKFYQHKIISSRYIISWYLAKLIFDPTGYGPHRQFSKKWGFQSMWCFCDFWQYCGSYSQILALWYFFSRKSVVFHIFKSILIKELVISCKLLAILNFRGWRFSRTRNQQKKYCSFISE